MFLDSKIDFKIIFFPAITAIFMLDKENPELNNIAQVWNMNLIWILRKIILYDISYLF